MFPTENDVLFFLSQIDDLERFSDAPISFDGPPVRYLVIHC